MPRKFLGLLLVLSAPSLAAAQDNHFTTAVGDVKVAPVKDTKPRRMPVLTWGGDVATLMANGGVNTTKDSIFGRSGLNYKIENGDDFVKQVRNYLSGETPFLRGTFTMFGEASEITGAQPDTKIIVLFQETYSQGDHMVSRAAIKKLNDLKGKVICLQKFGPHVALVGDSLKAAGLTWADITVVWAKNLTGPDSPEDMMRKDSKIDAACVITPDMEKLTGGLKSVGTKEGEAEGNIDGGHVLVSTADANRSIADVVGVRADFFKAHREECEKLTASYLQAVEQLLAAKQVYDNGKGKSPTYTNALTLAQQFYGKDVIPNIETTAHGMVEDAIFVRMPGNVSFFTDAGNLNGFAAKQKSVLDTMQTLKYVTERRGFDTAHWDWPTIAKLAGIPYSTPKPTQNKIAAESLELFPDSVQDDSTIVSFTIQFGSEQSDFPIDTYAAEFQKVVQATQTFGNCVVAIEGHSDPGKTLVDLLKAGMKKGLIQRSGKEFFYKGKPLDLNATADIIAAIQTGEFSGVPGMDPLETMQAATNLSQSRAQAVKKSVVEYAKAHGINLDPTQVQPVGVGIRRPLIAKPTNPDESLKNMRVQFSLRRVPAEAIQQDDFDLLNGSK